MLSFLVKLSTGISPFCDWKNRDFVNADRADQANRAGGPTAPTAPTASRVTLNADIGVVCAKSRRLRSWHLA